MSRSLLFSLVCALFLGAASSALAAGQETTEYAEAVNLGLSEFDEKNFLEARVHFSRAHSIYPNARTLRALGMVHFELKEYAESVRYLNEALSSNERPLDPDKRDRTEKLLARALGYIARLTLEVAPETRVTVDGKATNLSSGSELVLGVGEHTLEFRAPGRITDRRTIKVQGGENETLRVQLATLSAARTEEKGPADQPKGRPVYKSPWLWTALGVVLAGAAAGTAVALTRKTTIETERPYGGTAGVPPLMGVSQ